MLIFCVFLFIFFSRLLNAGNVTCGQSKTKSHVYSRSHSVVRDQAQAAKELADERAQELIRSVNAMPIPRVFMLHRRAATTDFKKFDLDEVEQAIFRSALARRYEEHRIEFESMHAESIERARRALLVDPARQKMRDRRKRRATIVMGAPVVLIGSLSPTMTIPEPIETKDPIRI
jgi:hypothetical protein